MPTYQRRSFRALSGITVVAALLFSIGCRPALVQIADAPGGAPVKLRSHSIFLDTGSRMGPFWDDQLAYLTGALDAVDVVCRSLGSMESKARFRYSLVEGEVERSDDLTLLAKVITHNSLKGTSRLPVWLSGAGPDGPESLAVFVGTWPEQSMELKNFRRQLSLRNGWRTPAIAVVRFTPALPAEDSNSGALVSLYLVLLGEQSVVTEAVKRINSSPTGRWPRKEVKGVNYAIIAPRPFNSPVEFEPWNLEPDRAAGFRNDDVEIATGESGPVVGNRADSTVSPFTIRIASVVKRDNTSVAPQVGCFAQLLAATSLAVSNSSVDGNTSIDKLDWSEVRVDQSKEVLARCEVRNGDPLLPFMKLQNDGIEVGQLALELVVNRNRIRARYPSAKTAKIKVLLTGSANNISLPSWIVAHSGERSSSLTVDGVSVFLTPRLTEHVTGLAQLLEEAWSDRVAQGLEEASISRISILVDLAGKL